MLAVVLAVPLSVAGTAPAGAAWSLRGAGAAAAVAQVLAPVTGLTATARCAPGPAAAFVASTTAGLISSTTTLTVPTATQAGDLIVVHITRDASTVTAPAGFALVRSDTSSAATSWAYQRVATATDAGKACSWTGSTIQGGGGLLVLRGAAGLTLTAEAAGSAVAGNSTTATAPSVPAGTANSLLVVLDAVLAGAASTFSTPAGTTARYTATGSGTSFAAFTEARAATGATGPRSSTLSTQGPVTAQALLVRPAGVPVADLSWTPSTSGIAGGYEIARDGATTTTVSPGTASTWTDPGPGAGSHAYAVRATAASWRSAPATATVTTGCP